MPNPYANHRDYELRTGQPSVHAPQVDVLLDEAAALVQASAPGLDERIDAGTIPMTLVTGICVRVVQRYLENPTRAIQLGTGPFIRGYSSNTAIGLALTDDEVASLNPPTAGGKPRGVGSFRTSVPVLPWRGRSCR